MKSIILIFVLGLAFADEEFDTINCLPMPEEGMCRGYFEMYYYDYQTRSCKTFIYGGCGGNGNRFPTEEECMEKCGNVRVTGSESVCDLPIKPGVCLGYFPRYYFDKETGTCKRFIYGGCGGNGNNFESEEECNQRCGIKAFDTKSCLLEPEDGMCRAYIPSYYYDYKTRTCKEFIYGGCDGNDNRFVDEDECMDKCGDVIVFESRSDSSCDLPLDEGYCERRYTRYYYDKEAGDCKPYKFTGNGASNNNFLTYEECYNRCVIRDYNKYYDFDLCYESMNHGICRIVEERYFFDKTTGKCKEFYYNGLGGNNNNFVNEEECYKRCGRRGVESAPPALCQLDKETGPCDALFIRYYYNKETGKCEEFVYGGCLGNENNFRTKEVCEGICQ